MNAILRDKKTFPSLCLSLIFSMIAFHNLLQAQEFDPAGCPTGMVSYWTFNDQSNFGKDEYGSNMGTLIGNTGSVPGIVEQALSFDGDSDRIEANTDNGIPYGNAPRTVAAWIKTNAQKDQIIFHYGTQWYDGGRFDLRIGNSGGCVGMYTDTGGVYALLTDTWGPGSAVCTTIPLDDGKWHHTAITTDGTTIKLYVDGQLSGQGTPTVGINTQHAYLPWIGAEPWYPPGDFAGLIDEVAVFNRALDATEIEALYSKGLQGKGYCVNDSDGDGIPDEADECPNSDLRPTVIIGSCDSGVDNEFFNSGCTISDLVMKCSECIKNHGEFVSCVNHLTNDLKSSSDLKKNKVITGKEKGAIQRCAGQADIP